VYSSSQLKGKRKKFEAAVYGVSDENLDIGGGSETGSKKSLSYAVRPPLQQTRSSSFDKSPMLTVSLCESLEEMMQENDHGRY